MADIVDKSTRSRIMSSIRGQNTSAEIAVRKGLFRLGFRYRINVRSLPGKPDIVLPKYNAIILINGCFWHGHDCHLFKLPTSNTTFWKDKFESNRKRDRRVVHLLKSQGWKVASVWECYYRGKSAKGTIDDTIPILAHWLLRKSQCINIRGKK